MRGVKAAAALLLCLLLVAACAPRPALIGKPARDMNLTVADLGSGFSLSAEQGLEEVKVSFDLPDAESVTDASFRTFQHESGFAFALIIVLDRPVLAADLADLQSSFEQGFASQIPEATLTTLTAPAIGDEATMSGASFPDLGMAMYFVEFRRANVLGVVLVVGLSEMSSEGFARGLGRDMAARVG